MNANRRSRWWALAGIGFLALVAIPQLVHAEDPTLVVQHVSGSSYYPVVDIIRLDFEGETLVVVTEGGSDHYPAEDIERIEFIWGVVDVKDPDDAAALAKAVHLFENKPNPFSPQTRIDFEVPEDGRVELTIYSVNGRLIRKLLDQDRTAGEHEVIWDGQDDTGQRVTSGVYFYKLVAPGVDESRKMILLP